MNNKGFTLVELLGSMVILGLLMMLVVPNIVGLLNSNKETVYVEDAKKLVNIAHNKAAMKTDVKLPTEEGKCVFLGMGYLENSEFSNPPNGGCYDVNRSFVAIKRTAHEYEYYVQLVEYKDGKRMGILAPTLSTSITRDTISSGNSAINFTYTNPGSITDTTLSSIGCTSISRKITKNGPKEYTSTTEGICAK